VLFISLFCRGAQIETSADHEYVVATAYAMHAAQATRGAEACLTKVWHTVCTEREFGLDTSLA